MLDKFVLRLAQKLVFRKIKQQIGPSLEFLICGSAALAEETQWWFELVGVRVFQVYGLTETTAIVTMDEPDDTRPHHHAVDFFHAPLASRNLRATGLRRGAGLR